MMGENMAIRKKEDVAKRFFQTLAFPVPLGQVCTVADSNPETNINSQTIRKYAAIFAYNGQLDMQKIGNQYVIFGWRALPNSKVNQDGRA